MKELRLTIIVMYLVDNLAEADTVYKNVKECLNVYSDARVTGNVTKIFDPCCGKDKKNGKNTPVPKR